MLTLAHCWAHTKRKYDEIATTWPTACAAIGALIGELYAIERLVPGSFPGDPGAQTLRAELRRDRSRPVLDQIWTWATEQAGLPRSDFGKAVRYMLERWTGLTRFVELCETAKLVGVDPHAYLLRALHAAIAQPGAVTYPEDLLTPQPA